MSLDLVVPFATHASTQRQHVEPGRAGRPHSGLPTVAFVDNTKAKAGVLLDAIGAALLSSQVIAGYFVHRKQLDMVPLEDDERDDLAARADVIVAGVGDCGGCTACSVTDALRCLEVGVPAFVVVTGRFAGVAAATEAEYGLVGLHHLQVGHPVWTRDAEWFRSTGAQLADAIRAVVRR